MLNNHSEALNFIERSQSCVTLDALAADFAGVVAGFGFHSFILTGLPSAGSDVEPLVTCNCWPDEWSARYRDEAYFADDPVSRWSLTKETPFYWSQARLEQTQRSEIIAAEAAELGLCDGIAFPMRTQRGWQAVMSLASKDKVDISKSGEGMLYMASIYFQMATAQIIPSDRCLISLTGREQEILQWAASGKTAWETSCILSISEKTVRNHVNSIHQKLDVRSTTQAVVVALRNHQLRL